MKQILQFLQYPKHQKYFNYENFALGATFLLSMGIFGFVLTAGF
ncbi:MAG TPA: hypothetical protein VFG25_01530 [Nitrosopumilaceae archaeon]|nr:hypothetical protein [Nitrosopumilaceae archaeon]